MYRMLGNVLLPSNYGHSHPVYWPYFCLTYVLHNMHHACIFLPFVTNVSPTTLCGQRNSYPFYGVLFNSGYQSNVGKKFPKMIHFAWVNVHMYTRTACCYTISATNFFLGNRRGVSPYWSYMLKMKRVLQVFTAKNNKVKLQYRL